ncbi:MAG: hypothetical protein ISS48_02740 [Candidatus Aenigmarchaeota archaeon]|nr:hypothetical protein [Candidatus Aenigmarchaeota archaeon]
MKYLKFTFLIIFSFAMLISFKGAIADSIDLGTYNVVEVNETLIQKLPNTDNEIDKNGEVRTLSIMGNSDDASKGISNDFIINNVGVEYFENHFIFKKIDEREFFKVVTYDFKYDDYSIDMFVAVSTDGKILPQFSHIIKEPQIISFSSSDAELKAGELSLPEPRKTSLIYSGNGESLAWKIEWIHEPTMDEMLNESISGYIFRADNGDIIEETKFRINPRSELSEVNNIKIIIIFALILLILVGLFIVKKRR